MGIDTGFAQYLPPWQDPLAGGDRITQALASINLARERQAAQARSDALGWARLQEQHRANVTDEGHAVNQLNELRRATDVDDKFNADKFKTEGEREVAKANAATFETAAKLVYSSDPGERQAGLDMLRAKGLLGPGQPPPQASAPAAPQPAADPSLGPNALHETIGQFTGPDLSDPKHEAEWGAKPHVQEHRARIPNIDERGMQRADRANADLIGQPAAAPQREDSAPQVQAPPAIGSPVMEALVNGHRVPLDPTSVQTKRVEGLRKATDAYVGMGGQNGRFNPIRMGASRVAEALMDAGTPIDKAYSAATKGPTDEINRISGQENARQSGVRFNIGEGRRLTDQATKQANTIINQQIQKPQVKAANGAIAAADRALALLDDPTALQDAVAVGELIKSLSGAAASNQEGNRVTGAGGVVITLKNMVSKLAGRGYSPEYREQLIALVRKMKESHLRALDSAGRAAAARASLDPVLGKDPAWQEYVFKTIINSEITGDAIDAAGDSVSGSSVSGGSFNKGRQEDEGDVDELLKEGLGL
ncbi:MAG: hypothetical protein NW202_13520 [Nitrospira sp.]|nr:hypothetical protein [Nitrospira sp.]